MRETTKSRELMVREGYIQLLRGRGLDIGCGDDPIRPLNEPGNSVHGWDKAQGDAQYLNGVKDATYDWVYSSHCLEHMVNVVEALGNWLRVLKPGGYLQVVVPDYTLYEQLNWPSRYNSDHKHSFSAHVTRRQVRRTNHWHLPFDFYPLFHGPDRRFTEADTGLNLSVFLEDEGFDYNRGGRDQTLGEALAQIRIIVQKAPFDGRGHV